jgi:hypothetical protein
MKTSLFREQQIDMLETAAAAGEDSPEREALMVACDLSVAFGDILATVLARGRWRAAEYPVEYVRRSAMRAVFRRDDVGKNPHKETSGYSNDDLGKIHEAAETSGVAWVPELDAKNKRTGKMVQRRGGGEQDPTGRVEVGVADRPIRRVPSELLVKVDPSELSDEDREWIVDPLVFVNWSELAKRVGLDEWETRALLLKADGLTCYGALKLSENDSERRSIEAAWKRLERNGLKRLRSVLCPC